MSTDETLHFRGPIHLNCPHCHNPIELVGANPAEEVQCPSCGSSFHLDADHTQSWSSDKLPTLGKFELLTAVGRGAFGTVYRALGYTNADVDRIAVHDVLTDQLVQQFSFASTNVGQMTAVSPDGRWGVLRQVGSGNEPVLLVDLSGQRASQRLGKGTFFSPGIFS